MRHASKHDAISAPARTPEPVSAGPAPPFDPELAAVLAMIGEELPPTMTPDMIVPGREALAAMPSLSDEVLARGGAYTVEERRVPGPDGAPDITLLICRPTAASAAVGAIYYTHGAGMVMGDRRMGLEPSRLRWRCPSPRSWRAATGSDVCWVSDSGDAARRGWRMFMTDYLSGCWGGRRRVRAAAAAAPRRTGRRT